MGEPHEGHRERDWMGMVGSASHCVACPPIMGSEKRGSAARSGRNSPFTGRAAIFNEPPALGGYGGVRAQSLFRFLFPPQKMFRKIRGFCLPSLPKRGAEQVAFFVPFCSAFVPPVPRQISAFVPPSVPPPTGGFSPLI